MSVNKNFCQKHNTEFIHTLPSNHCAISHRHKNIILLYVLQLFPFHMGLLFCTSLCHLCLSHTWCSSRFFSSISTFSLCFHLYFGHTVPWNFHLHHSPFNIVSISSHHMPIPFQPSFLYLQAYFSHLHCSSYQLISDFIFLCDSTCTEILLSY